MRYLFLMFLVLSLPAMATDNPQASQKKEKVLQKEKVVESKELCDPKERTKMPETFY